MGKLREGEFSIETEHGVFDLFLINQDKKELDVLSILREDLLKDSKFAEAKIGRVDLASIAAFIMYIDSMCEIMSAATTTDKFH